MAKIVFLTAVSHVKILSKTFCDIS